jgi:NodT family efflux transporter outer membrane factor (OMF) lipoprotein
MSAPRTILRRALTVCGALAVAACTVGPDFETPKAPAVSGYLPPQAEARPPATDGVAPQRVALGDAVAKDWWRLFRSPALDEVVRLALGGNRTLVQARATLAQFRASADQARGAYYPQIDGTGSVQRRQSSSSGSSVSSSGGVGTTGVSRGSNDHPFTTESNQFAVGLSATYMLDVWGATTRLVEQQDALAEQQAYQLAAAYLTLTGTAVQQAVTIASLRLQIAAVEDIVADDRRTLDLVERRFQAGKGTRTEVLTARSQLATDFAQLPQLRQQLAAARHALTILLGKFPAEWMPPDFNLADFVLPDALPVSLPSELVRQRPDILSAEAALHAASAAIGVAQAAKYPRFDITGTIGQQAIATNVLFGEGTNIWSIVGAITAPLFHGGALDAQKRAAVEAFEASYAGYQQTVLTAFGQVADTLRAIGHDAELVDAQFRALDTARSALDLQRLSYDAGKTDLFALLDLQRQYQQARLGHAQAVAQRRLDTVQLLVAMGGGWWHERAALFAPKPEKDVPAKLP